MKNKSVFVFANSIPYIKQFRLISESVTGAVLLQQLEYWFAKYPKGFYKYLTPCPNIRTYNSGDSWLEELNFSRKEFHGAFDKIGVRYQSKKDYINQKDPFQGKYYCSYHDKISRQTWYFRNHKKMDAALDNIMQLIKSEESEEFDIEEQVTKGEVSGLQKGRCRGYKR